MYANNKDNFLYIISPNHHKAWLYMELKLYNLSSWSFSHRPTQFTPKDHRHLDKDCRSKKSIGFFGLTLVLFWSFEIWIFIDIYRNVIANLNSNLSYRLRSWGLLIHLHQAHSLANSTSLGTWCHSARFLGTFTLHAWELSAAFFIIVLETLYH